MADLRSRANAARKRADELDAKARDAKAAARDAAVEAVALEAEVDAAEWFDAQLGLGVSEDAIDLANRRIRGEAETVYDHRVGG